jgi:hypothetical protein
MTTPQGGPLQAQIKFHISIEIEGREIIKPAARIQCAPVTAEMPNTVAKLCERRPRSKEAARRRDKKAYDT